MAGLAPTSLGVQSHSTAIFFAVVCCFFKSTVIAADQLFHGVRIRTKHVKYVSSLLDSIKQKSMNVQSNTGNQHNVTAWEIKSKKVVILLTEWGKQTSVTKLINYTPQGDY